jgi:hypothetical protein
MTTMQRMRMSVDCACEPEKQLWWWSKMKKMKNMKNEMKNEMKWMQRQGDENRFGPKTRSRGHALGCWSASLNRMTRR